MTTKRDEFAYGGDFEYFPLSPKLVRPSLPDQRHGRRENHSERNGELPTESTGGDGNYVENKKKKNPGNVRGVICGEFTFVRRYHAVGSTDAVAGTRLVTRDDAVQPSIVPHPRATDL